MSATCQFSYPFSWVRLNKSGFTLIELLVTLGIIGVILAFSFVGLGSLIPKQEADSTIQTLLSDLTAQQTKAQTGDRQSADGFFGVRFNQSEYVLFEGQIYDPNNANNLSIQLTAANQFANIDLPDQSIVFSPVTGDVFNWDKDASSSALLNVPTNRQITISINPYGTLFVR